MKLPSALALLLSLAACGGPPPPPPTLVSVVATAESGSNAGAPVALRVYQLASPAAFDGAQFFAVFNGDAAVLKDDLVKRDDMILAPGQSKTIALAPADRVTTIGVFGAYRDVETTTWRATVAVPAHQSSVLTVTSGPTGVSAKIAPAK